MAMDRATRGAGGRRKLSRGRQGSLKSDARAGLKLLPGTAVRPILAPMSSNPLTVLRLAMPGQPSLRDIAEQVGCSHTHLNKFERGELALEPELLKRYAKAVNATVAEVERRWLELALDENLRRRQELHSRLKELGVADPRRRPRRKSA